LGWLSDPFKGLSDLQLGDEKGTLNHLEWNDLFFVDFHETQPFPQKSFRNLTPYRLLGDDSISARAPFKSSKNFFHKIWWNSQKALQRSSQFSRMLHVNHPF